MVQCFTELQGVHQGAAVSVGIVVLVQVFAGKKECCDLFAVGSEPDILKVAAHAHKKCATEDVGGF